MNSMSHYRNFRANLDKYTNWNFYAGTREFATDRYLQFENPVMEGRYEAENRSKGPIKALIGVSFISYITSELIYNLTDLNVCFVLSV